MKNKLLHNILQIGAHPSDNTEAQFAKQFGAVASLIAMSILLFFLTPPLFLFGEPVGGLIIVGLVAFIAIDLAVYHLIHRNLSVYLNALATAAVFSHLLFSWAMGGFFSSFAMPLWGIYFPAMAMLIFLPLRFSIFWLIIVLINLAVCIFTTPLVARPLNLPVLASQLFLYVNLVFIVLNTFIAFGYFVYQRNLAFRLLRNEQVKAENLLLNILPSEIATILKNDQRTIAQHFDGASILFADIVNFTPLSATMTPTELVELLNEVFSQFDELVEKYGLEKIKTIGDCYMVASGVPRPRPDHAQIITRLALDMRELVATKKFHGRQIDFRIGINSGPVVAGVIGRKKFIYDLWGDAVNTASRMESHGSGGTIQITADTWHLVQNDFICEPRGKIKVKGKEEMEVWSVISPKVA